MVGTGLRFALAAPSLPPSDSSLALPVSGDQEKVTTCLNLN